MANFSFDIVSEYDKAEMNNVFAQTEKELAGRYDFKGTSAGIEWLADKSGLKITGDGEWQIEAVLDIVRKKLATRNQSSKTLDLSKEIHTSNLKSTKEIPFKEGLSQDNAKEISKQVRENFSKAKPQIQGDAVRIMSSSKDELQEIMRFLQAQDFDFAINFTNYR